MQNSSGMGKAVSSGKTAGPPRRPRKAGKSTPQAQAEPDPGRRSHRHIEIEWRRTHYNELAPFVGQWVVLEREEIVSHGDDAGEVVAAARRKGVEVPYIFRVVPDYGKNVATIGL